MLSVEIIVRGDVLVSIVAFQQVINNIIITNNINNRIADNIYAVIFF